VLPGENGPQLILQCAYNCSSLAGRFLLVQFATSELSEILSSMWGAALLFIGYNGPNRMAFDGMRDLDDESFAQAMKYSLVDAGVEGLMFAVLASYLYSSLGVRAVPTFATYVKTAKMVVPFAAICSMVPAMALGFFLEHMGFDASFRFAWLRGDTNGTVLS
jgi:hypothetical protein